MSPRLLTSVLLIASSHLIASAPEKADGNAYYEYTSVGAGLVRSFSVFAVVLKSDGTFTGLFKLTTDFRGGPYLSAQGDGSYTYRKLDDSTAELSLSGQPQNSSGSILRQLKFSDEKNGTIPIGANDSTTNSQSFRLGSLASAPPLLNCSNRSFVRPGTSAFTGFVVGAGNSGSVLVRASGPSLALFGVTDALRNPLITVMNLDSAVERFVFHGRC